MAGAHGLSRAGLRASLDRTWPVALFGVVPLVMLALLLRSAWEQHIEALDFHGAFWPAGRAVLDGQFAYPRSIDVALIEGDPFVYPPLTAVLFVPFALLSRAVADGLYTAVSVGAVLLSLRVFQVRDWRCYGLVLLWPPILAAAQAGNLSLLLTAVLGLLWRWRNRVVLAGLTTAVLISAKLFLWPVAIWLLLTRRYAVAAWSGILALALNAVAWWAIGAGSVGHYLHLLRRLAELQGPATYTVGAFAQRIGLPGMAGKGVTVLIAAALVYAGSKVRDDDRRGLAIAVLCAVVLSPIVWLHYLALLAVPVGLTRPTLSWTWFVPLALVFCPGKGSGTLAETALALTVVGFVAASVLTQGRITRNQIAQDQGCPGCLTQSFAS